MPGSQLKRLKASLRDQGVIGPQQSKKQKRRVAEEQRGRNDKRLNRGAILSGIREQFNPFDLKHATRGPKFDVTTNVPPSASAAKGIQGRPAAARAAGEERRRETLLVDMQRRNKVGGILDRRFGENDPTMAPEDKMLQRFAREKQRAYKKSSMFDLEDDGPIESLTHQGKPISFEDDEEPVDDFQEEDLDAEDSDGSVRGNQRLKRLRSMAEDGIGEHEPERKKSKKEVMDEIIAKSKLHKHERQAAKEGDDEMRATIDKQLPDIQMLLATSSKNKRPEEIAEGSKIGGLERQEFDRNFDLQVKRLAQDRRAQPLDRTKTEEEKLQDESTRLRELEEKRQRRMRGESVSDSDESEVDKGKEATGNDVDDDMDDGDAFGLGQGIRTRTTAADMDLDDEDNFIIDNDLVASGSDLDLDESGDESDGESDDESASSAEEEDDEFIKGLLNEEESKNPVFQASAAAKTSALEKGDEDGLPFTFPCPETVEDLQAITVLYRHTDTPKIVQRIRALYHPKLDSRNKERLGNFAKALVDYVAAPWDPVTAPPAAVVESVVRHIHSLAKMFPVEVSDRFRHHLQDAGENRRLTLEPSDLLLLSAVGSVFPTSDHFHQVVTPAMLTIGRYLGQRVPRQLSDLATGMYLCILALQYQQLAKRYVPEVINFAVNAVYTLAPVAAPASHLSSAATVAVPIHNLAGGERLVSASLPVRRLRLVDCVPDDPEQPRPSALAAELSASILATALHVLDAAADLWVGQIASAEIFAPALRASRHLVQGAGCRCRLPPSIAQQADRLAAKLSRAARLAHVARRPLTLHYHRPLAIKTFIPRFEETFDPDKHYDPDRERAELAKLRKEHRRERKGAMRELRRDAHFVARERLRTKVAQDAAYDKKFKRLVAEIQGEEGREANAYEREKSARKKANHR